MIATKIKICGLTRPQDIEYVNEAMPDYIGFVFAKSRRQVTTTTAANLKSSLNSNIKAVGVFVNEDPELIAYICNQGIIDIIQLHGDEDNDYIQSLRKKVGNTIIKAIRVRDEASVYSAEQLQADFLLLDAYSDKEFGGTGKTFNWKHIRCIEKPFFLAGGITLDNASEAIRSVKPFCLDLSSGVETNGFKDSIKIKTLIDEVRSVK